MGTKKIVMLKTHIDSIKLYFHNDFVYENLIWVLASIWIFLCNYVLHSIGSILTYIFRFHRKNEQLAPLALVEERKRNDFEDYEIDKFIEEIGNMIFQSNEDFYIASEGIEGETEYSVFEKSDSIDEKGKEEMNFYVLKKKDSDLNEDDKKSEGEINCDDVKKRDEKETECSVFEKGDSNFHQDGRMSGKDIQEEGEETKGSTLVDTSYDATISNVQFMSQKDIGDLEEEPMAFTSFSFLRNVCINENNVKKELLEHKLEACHVDQGKGEEGFLKYEIIGSNNSSEEYECENLKEMEGFKETQFSCDREEVSHDFVECKNDKEDSSYHGEETYNKTMYEEELDEMEYVEEDEDEYEYENDEVMEQFKLEMKIARQGGLATIFEDEERDNSSKVVEEKLQPLSIEEKMEYKDHIVEIQKVYRCYAQKIKKLDVLSYQTMHAIGLLRIKDPPKLFLMQNSTVKPLMISQNLWLRKAQKNTFNPMLKFVNELHRDLELVYVCQICLSWEILCWQHEKIQEMKKYDSQWPHRYNIVAGDFQLFQVLIQRFLEDEPFHQDHNRVQYYVNNRSLIRNLLQVPIIKDDSAKDKKKVKLSEEDAIGNERLEHIIQKSMQVFWEFVNADKDDENLFHKTSHYRENEIKNKEISDLVGNIRTQLHKKERMVKDKLRSGNCIVRKFQKHNKDQIQLDHDMLLAQVGLKLISRVINMKKLRKDHLIWCTDKLNQINFVDKKIQVKSSFLLFPC
ncbi:uncharacterized protein LOC131618866 [Vicia villosa]|uniref:uncharacterized protein LOC131618866 n=1 Tax=Vicia villosa TaxID=3911 RepID=UPI00273BC392|nr:uncharacterized protein LOC131618866 [Vicia villosa]